MVGTISTAINSDKVKLSLGSPLSEYITIYDIDESFETPRNSIHTRAGRADFWSAPLITFTATGLLSKDVMDDLVTAATLNARNALVATNFKIVGESVSGDTDDDVIVIFTGYVSGFSKLAPVQSHYAVRFTVIIQNSTYP